MLWKPIERGREGLPFHPLILRKCSLIFRQSQMFLLEENEAACGLQEHAALVCTCSLSKTKHGGGGGRKNLRDGVLLPSASRSAESAFLCPSPTPPSSVSLCCFLFTTKALFFPSPLRPSSIFHLGFPDLCLCILRPSPCPAKGPAASDERRAKPEPRSIRHPFALSSGTPPSLSPSLSHPSSIHSPSSSVLPGLPRLGSLHFSTRCDGERTQLACCS